jgi:hypothetical protein
VFIDSPMCRIRDCNPVAIESYVWTLGCGHSLFVAFEPANLSILHSIVEPGCVHRQPDFPDQRMQTCRYRLLELNQGAFIGSPVGRVQLTGCDFHSAHSVHRVEVSHELRFGGRDCRVRGLNAMDTVIPHLQMSHCASDEVIYRKPCASTR